MTAAENDPSRLRLLYDLGCAFAARRDLGELTALVLAKCRELLRAEAAAVLLLDNERNELFFPYVADESVEVSARLAEIRFPADRGIAGEVLRSGTPVRVDDASSDPRFFGGVDQRTGRVTRNLICVPLQSRQGAIGVVQVLNHSGGSHFDESDLRFLEALAGSIAVALENARFYAQLQSQVATLERAVKEHNELIAIRRELDVARNIQMSIVPRDFPRRRDFDLFATMEAANEVGGDFYDFFLIDAHRLGVVIGDVSGKGVPAALFMAMCRTLVKSIALDGGAPGDCLTRVNRSLCADNDAEMFVSLFYGVLDTRSGEVSYANGGHNPPLLLRVDRSLEPLPGTGGMVLAALPDTRYADATVNLQPGDGLFLYTDGVTEAMNRGDELFGVERLQNTLMGCMGASANNVIDSVTRAVSDHAAGAPQSDDVTALMVRYLGST